MPEKKKKPKNKYKFRSVIKCEKCNTEISEAGLCWKCKNDTFKYILKVVMADSAKGK